MEAPTAETMMCETEVEGCTDGRRCDALRCGAKRRRSFVKSDNDDEEQCWVGDAVARSLALVEVKMKSDRVVRGLESRKEGRGAGQGKARGKGAQEDEEGCRGFKAVTAKGSTHAWFDLDGIGPAAPEARSLCCRFPFVLWVVLVKGRRG